MDRQSAAANELEAARAAVARVSWFHSFEVVPGVRTPGMFACDAPGVLSEYGVRFGGQRVLEIGSWDGAYAFELERRGADVTALDIHDPDQTGFNIAKALRHSKVRYVRGSVYELATTVEGTFDLVCFFGVFYHLKHPIMALEQIAKVLRRDGLLLIEGECLRNYAETLGGTEIGVRHLVVGSRTWQRVMVSKRFPRLAALFARSSPWMRRLDRRPPISALGGAITVLADSEVPLALCYPGRFKQSSNWFIPNLACLRSWLEAAGFALTSHRVWDCGVHGMPDGRRFPLQRVRGIARKVGGHVLEHEVRG